MSMKKKVVIIGGGTGTFAILSALKRYDVDIAAIITMMDSGGSTGRLRDQYGVLPPGDIRQALVALSDSDKMWRRLFLYRFETGDLKGHNFGNIFLTALEKVTHDFEKSIETAQTILHTKGSVIPVTLYKTHIVATLTDGTIIKTEALIDIKEKRKPIQSLALLRKVASNPRAITALQEANLIIVAPGDLYTSILPNFMFNDIIQNFRSSKSPKVLISNLMNKNGQTDEFKLSDYIRVLSEYLGENPFSHILVNETPIPKEIITHYEQVGENTVLTDLSSDNKVTLYKKDFISDHIYKSGKGDILERSLLRHDGRKVAHFLWKNFLR